MKKVLLRFCVFVAALLISGSTNAQDWVSKMQDPSVNFFEVQKDFNDLYLQKERKLERERRKAVRKGRIAEIENDDEMPGYNQFKRWEWFMAPRVAENGDRFDPANVWRESVKYHQQYKTFSAGNWTLIGPSTTTAGLAGAGRLNFIRIDPNNANNLFVGSPGGGLWTSTNAGASWSTNTDNLPHVIGCTDIAIDPTNSNVMYLATGDGDGGDTYTVGVLKTIDGGSTWNPTGLTFNVANFRQMSRILIDPLNTNVILVATSGGIYRSADAGVSFTQVQTGSFKDMELKPTDPNTVYACGTEFYKSTDNGQSWTKITAGLPAAAGVSRLAIAVSPADPNYVYMIAGLPQPNYGTQGFYKSINSGTSFTKPSTPALGAQQWYDLAIAISPTNKDEVILGGQTDFQRSIDGGLTWAQNGSGTHVDYHDIVFVSPTSYYTASDGGIYRTTNSGGSWSNLNHQLQISQMYGFGQSSTDPNLLIQGWQDNGTNRYNGTNWSGILGGDGMLCFIDWNDDMNMWGEQFNGNLNRSTNGGASFSAADNGITEAGAWVTPWLQDPVDAGTIYVGMINVWKSLNGGISWTKISSFTNTGTLNTIAVSPANNQVIWAAKASGLYMTNNGGTSWTQISSIPSGTITSISCSNTDEYKAWITYSGFNNTNKVFQTNDQGVSWTNLSASIPNIPVNCATYLNNSNDGLYIGTDLGIFYKDASLSVWQPFFSGMPNVVVTQLSIFYPTGKIRASTYGRGMWESDLYIAGNYAPEAAFGSSARIACPGNAVQFSDYSAGQPTSWSWSFPGGSPATSTLQNPLVYYNTVGSFPVTLASTNAIGSDTITTNSFVSIASSPFNAPATVGAQFCGPNVVNLSATGSGTGTIRWWDAPGGGNVVATGNNYSPNLTSTTTFYVDEDFPAGAQDYTGETGNSVGAGAFFTASDIRGLYFDVLNPVILNTVDVYANSAGNRTIEIIDNQGNLFVDTTIFIPASPTIPYTVNLDFKIYPGTNYFIKCRGLVDLYRNSAGAIYPYVSTDVNVTNSNASIPGYYYFFYNWTYTAITCNTARSAVSGIDTCAIIGINDIKSDNFLGIYPNPNNGIFSVSFNTIKMDNYRVVITNAIGETVYKEDLNAFTGEYLKKINISEFGKGVYIVNVTNSEMESNRKVMIY